MIRKILFWLVAFVLWSTEAEALGVASASRAGSAYQPSTFVSLYVNAVVANGGSVSSGRRATYLTLFTCLQGTQALYAMDDGLMLMAENTQTAHTSLKQRRLATDTAAPTFTTDRGIAYNGSTQFTDTGANLATTSVMMGSGTDVRMSIYERVLQNANRTSGGVLGTVSTASMRIVAQSSGAMSANAMSNGVTQTVATSLGYSVAYKVGNSTSIAQYKNGVSLGTATASAVSTALPSFNMYIGARNNQGTADTFRTSTEGYMDWGAPLPSPSTQELPTYNCIQAYATTVGGNV